MAENGSLAGRVAVVTGGTGAIGSAIATAFHEAGATVAVVARTRQSLDALCAGTVDAPERLAGFTCDVRDGAQLECLASRIAERWPRIDVLCTCAGIMRTGALDRLEPDVWNELLSTNVTGTFQTIRAFGPLMASPSSIITLGSTAGLRPVPNFAAYTTTKAAIIHMTQACALDYASRGIRVNCICPGVVRSRLHESLSWPSADMFYASMEQATPLGDLGTPEDVAHAALFLANSGARWMTGALLVLDGGLSLV